MATSKPRIRLPSTPGGKPRVRLPAPDEIQVKRFEPLSLPAPWSSGFALDYRRRLKVLGISPSVDNGIRTWRVIWRPFLVKPVPFTRPDGTGGLRYKSHRVRTRRFAITGSISEEAAFRRAALIAAIAYRGPVAKVLPLVHWEHLAKVKRVKLRQVYAKPALNGARERALALFAKGYGDRQVAAQLGVDRSTAGKWRRRAQRENAPSGGADRA